MEQNTKKGTLEIICGSMFSGKSEELMKRLRRAEYARQNVLTIKHKIDIRTSKTCITSHAGNKRLAFSIDNKLENIEKILNLANNNIQVVGIDELHFFPQEIVPIICKLVEKGKRVIGAGLELNYRGEMFEPVPTLMAIADEVIKLKAICVKCGKDAHFTQRVINGKPAKYDDPTILVGAQECYEARCRDCHEIDKMPTFFIPTQKPEQKQH
jgi:thymidine kinase